MSERDHPPTHRVRNVIPDSAPYVYWMFIYRMDDGRWKKSYAPGTWNADGTPYHDTKNHKPIDLATIEPIPYSNPPRLHGNDDTPNDWPSLH